MNTYKISTKLLFVTGLSLSLFFATSCNRAKQDGKEPAADAGHGHPHGATKSEPAKKITISKQALKNMGVKIDALKLAEYTVVHRVPAVIRQRQINHFGVYSPWSGVVTSVKTSLGQSHSEDEVLVEILRDELPQLELKYTGELYTRLQDKALELQRELALVTQKEINVKVELKRLQALQPKGKKSLPVIPKKDLLALEYQLKELQAEKEAVAKSLSYFESAPLENLEGSNFWGEQAAALFTLIKTGNKAKSIWEMFVVADLQTSGQLTKEHVDLIKESKDLQKHFLAVAPLIQQGWSAAQLRQAAKDGLFAEKMQIKLRQSGDVEKLLVTVGQRIERGQELLELQDSTQMHLEALGRGSEKQDLRRAAHEDLPLIAEPVVPGSAANYTNLSLLTFYEDEHSEGAMKAVIGIKNRLLKEKKIGDRSYRRWDLIEGARFFLKIPVKRFKGVFVLPVEALVSSGPDMMVLVKVGKDFIERKVVLLHRDAEFIVLSDESDMFAGEPVVMKGAFEIQQAIQAGGPQAIDPHAGHNH